MEKDGLPIVRSIHMGEILIYRSKHGLFRVKEEYLLVKREWFNPSVGQTEFPTLCSGKREGVMNKGANKPRRNT